MNTTPSSIDSIALQQFWSECTKAEPLVFRPINYLDYEDAPFAPVRAGKRTFRAPELLSELIILLEDINANPDAGIARHYTNCGLSAKKGNQLRQLLEEKGLVTVESEVRGFGAPVKILRITGKGRELLQKEGET